MDVEDELVVGATYVLVLDEVAPSKNSPAEVVEEDAAGVVTVARVVAGVGALGVYK